MAGVSPDNAPPLYVGETRQFNWEYKTAGDNAIITDGFSVTCIPTSMLTFEDTAGEGLTGTTFATAAQAGCGSIIATAQLTSGETIKLKVRVKVCDPTQTDSNRDYD
jgi:hypothetical protein